MGLVEGEKYLSTRLVVDDHGIDIFTLDDRLRQCREADKMLQRQTGAKIGMHRVLNDLALCDELVDMELLVGALTFAVTDIDEQQERQRRHHEQSAAVDKAPAETCTLSDHGSAPWLSAEQVDEVAGRVAALTEEGDEAVGKQRQDEIVIIHPMLVEPRADQARRVGRRVLQI